MLSYIISGLCVIMLLIVFYYIIILDGSDWDNYE